MGKKRVINRDDYPMVLDWNGYMNTKSKLPCRCQNCHVSILRTIKYIDKQQGCFCKRCSYKLTSFKKYGTSHPFQNTEIKDKRKQTFLKNYGVENPFQSEEIKNKIKQTNLERLGVEYSNQSEKIRDKTKQTNLKKYGVENPFQSDIVKEKIKQTNLKKYGVENPSKCEKIKKKISSINKNKTEKEKKDINTKRSDTNIKKYGVKHASLSNAVKEKVKQTNLDRYGVPSFQQRNRELWQIEITSSKEKFEEYLKSLIDNQITSQILSEILGFNTRDTIHFILNKWDLWSYISINSSSYELILSEYISSLGFDTQKKRFSWGEIDILIPELNIGFEFNGCYWHTSDKREKYYHQNKIKNAKHIGIKLYHLWEDDYLKDKETFFENVKYIIEKQPDFKFVEPILVERVVNNQKYQCWGEGIIFS